MHAVTTQGTAGWTLHACRILLAVCQQRWPTQDSTGVVEYVIDPNRKPWLGAVMPGGAVHSILTVMMVRPPVA